VGEAPLVKAISGKHGVEIGGFAVHSSGKRVVICATIDNLLKGAATQCLRKSLLPNSLFFFSVAPGRRDARLVLIWHDFIIFSFTNNDIENMNLARGYGEFEGIPLMD
jgi:N-acetyl-gamma-glutamyl-phosphate reductase/acetylglutamate kinase